MEANMSSGSGSSSSTSSGVPSGLLLAHPARSAPPQAVDTAAIDRLPLRSRPRAILALGERGYGLVLPSGPGSRHIFTTNHYRCSALTTALPRPLCGSFLAVHADRRHRRGRVVRTYLSVRGRAVNSGESLPLAGLQGRFGDHRRVLRSSANTVGRKGTLLEHREQRLVRLFVATRSFAAWCTDLEAAQSFMPLRYTMPVRVTAAPLEACAKNNMYKH